jgi:hypothetical protein
MSNHIADLRAIRLMSKTRRDRVSGRYKVASASKRIIDIAAAVHVGLIADVGLPSLLYRTNKKRVGKLLLNNFVGRVTPKANTIGYEQANSEHATSAARFELSRALTKDIGPLYFNQIRGNVKSVRDLVSAFKPKAVVNWLIAEIENPQSELNKIVKRKYPYLAELKRSRRWWSDELIKSAE